jgi:hypothetical protein
VRVASVLRIHFAIEVGMASLLQTGRCATVNRRRELESGSWFVPIEAYSRVLGAGLTALFLKSWVRESPED